MTYSNVDKYLDFHVTFVKGMKISEENTVMLSDMGFPYDLPYPTCEYDTLSDFDARNIAEEFAFLIENLLPRNIQDLFYKIALKPCKAYYRLFEEAGKELGLEIYDDKTKLNYGQFKDFTEKRVNRLLEMGVSLTEIYDTTCVTKVMVIDAARYGKLCNEMIENDCMMPTEESKCNIGLVKSAKIISNLQKDFWKVPGHEEEVEQHLTIFDDGTIELTKYNYGAFEGGEYEEIGNETFKISAAKASYLLVTLGMYFDELKSFDSANGNYCWYVELLNSEGKKTIFDGKLCSDLFYRNECLSDLIREYVGRSDLILFDGDKREPIKLKEGEYIFVDVDLYDYDYDRNFCYICEDPSIRKGDYVLVPFGSKNYTEEGHVDCVRVLSKENAPYPVEKCKKVIKRVISQLHKGG